MDHNVAPILDAINRYHELNTFAYGPPGHKQGSRLDEQLRQILGTNAFRSDILSAGGLDDRTESNGVLTEAQDLMADAVGAEKAFFATAGSSLSVKSCMLAVAGPGDKIMINRDAHKSAISGLMLSGAIPVWVEPNYDMERHLAHPPSLQNVIDAFDSEAKGMLLASPTDYGTCADIEGITGFIHSRNLTMIVDEAWGAAFPFYEEGLPQWGMNVGADLCVTSVHKTGGGLEQSSVFHLQGDRVDPSVLSNRMELLSTTSNSILIYAALDGWRRLMMQEGKNLLKETVNLTKYVRREIRDMDPYIINDVYDMCGFRKSFEFDPQRIIVDVSGLDISGYQASDWMLENTRCVLGVADHRRVAALFTYADSLSSANHLIESFKALKEAAKDLPKPAPVKLLESPSEYKLEQGMLPHDAFFASAEMVSADKAVGRISAEMLTPYPPGVPIVVPGEVLTKPVIDYLQSGLKAGMVVQDAHDSSLETFRVVSK